VHYLPRGNIGTHGLRNWGCTLARPHGGHLVWARAQQRNLCTQQRKGASRLTAASSSSSSSSSMVACSSLPVHMHWRDCLEMLSLLHLPQLSSSSPSPRLSAFLPPPGHHDRSSRVSSWGNLDFTQSGSSDQPRHYSDRGGATSIVLLF